jgi:hypothetical protein
VGSNDFEKSFEHSKSHGVVDFLFRVRVTACSSTFNFNHDIKRDNNIVIDNNDNSNNHENHNLDYNLNHNDGKLPWGGFLFSFMLYLFCFFVLAMLDYLSNHNSNFDNGHNFHDNNGKSPQCLFFYFLNPLLIFFGYTSSYDMSTSTTMTTTTMTGATTTHRQR